MSAPPPVKKLKTEVRRLDGMQRELYSLLGENTPPVMVAPNKFKSKPDWRQKVTPWSWHAFENKSRDDSLVLHHWVRGQPDDEEPYRFAKFNVKLRITEWSDEDYQLFKRDGWSLDETRYLFNLCLDYDLRWLVIHDRYDYKDTETPTELQQGSQELKGEQTPEVDSKEADTEMAEAPDTSSNAGDKSTPDLADLAAKTPNGRTVEDLKDRYYEVSRALLKRSNHLSPADEELLEQMNFSKENEVKRKAHLERLLSRSPNEVAEEEALVLECRRLEALAEQMVQERAEIFALLDTPATTGSIAQYQSSQGVATLHQQLMQEKSRKPKDVTVGVSGSSRRPDDRKSGLAAQIIQKRLSAKEEAAYGISYHERASAGVYVRSSKLSSLKQSQAVKAQAVLNELGLPVKPVMPTAKVCAKFDTLLQSVTVLLDAKRHMDKLEAEIQVLKQSSVKPE